MHVDELAQLPSYKGYDVYFAPKDANGIVIRPADEEAFGKLHYRCDIRAYHPSQRRDLPDVIFSLRLSQVDATSASLQVLTASGPQDKLWSHLRDWAEATAHTVIDHILA
jgi:hypothetical protein